MSSASQRLVHANNTGLLWRVWLVHAEYGMLTVQTARDKLQRAVPSSSAVAVDHGRGTALGGLRMSGGEERSGQNDAGQAGGTPQRGMHWRVSHAKPARVRQGRYQLLSCGVRCFSRQPCATEIIVGAPRSS